MLPEEVGEGSHLRGEEDGSPCRVANNRPVAARAWRVSAQETCPEGNRPNDATSAAGDVPAGRRSVGPARTRSCPRERAVEVLAPEGHGRSHTDRREGGHGVPPVRGSRPGSSEAVGAVARASIAHLGRRSGPPRSGCPCRQSHAGGVGGRSPDSAAPPDAVEAARVHRRHAAAEGGDRSPDRRSGPGGQAGDRRDSHPGSVAAAGGCRRASASGRAVAPAYGSANSKHRRNG